MEGSLEAELLKLAGGVLDPELPVLSLAELGVVRGVHVYAPGRVEVELTPTYTGCPAVEAMSADIERALIEHGDVARVRVRLVLEPAWTTDDITAEGRRKLREFGIAPPRPTREHGPVAVGLGPTRTATDAAPAQPGAATPEAVRCPRCDSPHTTLLSRFSSTACKALRRCEDCREPFDHFKELT
ncbi:1,2-phenylacetyl-CoA epoxidase subunit PaaD [Streptomyces polyrhachis]|uniref:1,2-phenylacetyl-CoA epoxidase subunit PaaD n=1 Tax=Streptomyces polyrhachis TaxID=1282885 RepID=A0ABW2GBI5_9ACTN